MCECEVVDRLIAAECKLQTVETLSKMMVYTSALLSETVGRLSVCLDEWESTEDVIALIELRERMSVHVKAAQRLTEYLLSDAASIFVNTRVQSCAQDNDASPSAISSCGDSEQLCTNAHIAEGDF